MKRVSLILLVMVVLAASGCTVLEKPPTPLVTAGDITVPALLGTYGWSAPGHAVQSDAPVPDEFVASANPVSLPSCSVLKVDYARRPQELFAYRWVDHEPIRIEIARGVFSLPQEPGTYVYSLESTWREGHASHVIKVAVTPD